ncbi:MAG: TonB-dependent receptor [Gemmatimonadota bacterium]|nr:TonB-dependent receptor [Gemmatimonadota bacterium]
MKRASFVVLGFLLLTGAASTSAQNPGAARPAGPPGGQPPAANGEVRGAVMDGDANIPVARATIVVRARRDSSLVTGTVARDDGTFRVQGLRPGEYYLRITSIGYGPRNELFTVGAEGPQAIATVSVKLSKVAVTLTGVEVTAAPPTITIEPDRNSYKAKDVAATATNASDVLDHVPSVAVDGDGKVSLRGNENVAIQINGRPAPVRGTQLGSYLKQLPASIVERVEVIPTPSAREDPEGMAGIINIVLKQNVDLGLSGGVTVGSAAANGRYNMSGNIGNQTGPWTLFTTYGYNADDRGIVGINDREKYNTLGLLSGITEQDLAGRNVNAGHNFSTNVDYKLNDRDVLTNVLALNFRDFTDNTRTGYTELSSARSILDRYDRIKDSDVNSWVADYTLAWKRTIEPRKHEISTEIRLNRAADDDHTMLWRQPPASSSSTRLEGERNTTDALTRTFNGQLDYTRTLAARTKLETGFRSTARWLDRDYLVEKDALGTNQWVISNLSNDFNFNEQVQAAYGVLSHGLGKWELQGGLRAEYANRDFALKNPSTSYPFSYTSVYPSGIARYKISDATEAKVGYSRRVRRPGTQELNPFPSFFDVQNVFIGNPNLRPEYTDAIELGWSRNGAMTTVQLSPFYRRTTDVMRVDINTADIIDGREVTSVSFKNLETSTSWGSDLNSSLKYKMFNGFANFSLFRVVTDGGSLSTLSSDAVTWTTRWNGTVTLTPATTVQATYFYRAPVDIERGRFSAQYGSNFSIRQKLMQDKGTISLRFQDPFNTIGFKIKAGDDNLTQITERKFGVRATYLTFQYNFGRPPRVRQPTQDQQPQGQTGFPPP